MSRVNNSGIEGCDERPYYVYESLVYKVWACDKEQAAQKVIDNEKRDEWVTRVRSREVEPFDGMDGDLAADEEAAK